MRHCQNCNKDYTDKYFNKHCRSNIHLKKAFEVKYIYKKENILVGKIDKILSSIIEKHKRKVHSFLLYVGLMVKKLLDTLNEHC